MTTFSQQNMYLGIGLADSGLADDAALTSSTQAGQFCVLIKETGVVEAGAIADATKYKFAVKKADGTYRFSSPFTKADIISKTYLAYAAPVEQVSYLGANAAGTIGGIGTITAGNNYIVNATLLHSQTDTNNTPLVKTFAHQAITGDTQQTVVKGLFGSAARVLNRGLAEKMISVDRIASGATNTGAAFTGSATILKFTKGSKVVSTYIKAAAGNTTLTASTNTVAAGDLLTAPSSNGRSFTFTASALGSGAGSHVIYIGTTGYRIADGGTDEQNATAIAAAINAGTQATATASTTTVTITYNKNFFGLPPMVLSSADDSTFAVVAVTTATGESMSVKYAVEATTSAAATFNLDEPWQGETGYVYSTTIDSAAKFTYLTGKYTIGATPLWGLKFTGLPLKFNPIVGKYQKVRFEVLPESNVNVPINLYTGTAYSVMQGFDTAVTYGVAQVASEGSGTYEQVSEQEALVRWANRGNTQIQAWPPTDFTLEATDVKYNIIQMTVKNDLNGTPGVQPKTYTQYMIAIDASLFDSGEDGDDIKTALGVS